MTIRFGDGKTQYGPGVLIELEGKEIALAIYAYLQAHDVHISGPTTITVNGKICEVGQMYVDPTGRVVADGIGWNGRGHNE